MDRQISVVIVDDDDDTRVLLRVMLDADDRFVVAGQASDGATAAALIAATQPDMAVVDLQLPVLDGLGVVDAARRSAPATKIVVFSAFPDPFTLLDVLGRGAHALLNKAAAWSELIPTIVRLVDEVAEAVPAGAPRGD